MPAITASLSVTVCAAGEGHASFAALHDAILNLPEDVAGGFCDLLIALADRDDLVRAETALRSADGAAILQAVQILPSDGYRELVTAVAEYVDGDVIRSAHGWPILSMVSGDSIVAEAGAATSGPGGGQA